MDNLILLGAIVYIILLIVVLCNMKNDKIKFILLLNGIILPLLLYYIFPNNFIEGFNEPKSPKLKALKKQALEIISSDDDDKTKKNKLLLALNKTKWMIPAPADLIKILAFLFDRFKLFPITRDQVTMLLEGNTCQSEELFNKFEIIPIEFSIKNLSYLRQ